MNIVALATYGTNKGFGHADCMAALKHELGILTMETRGHSHIDVARSVLATAALAHGAEVLVFIDHDTLFDPLDVPRLAACAAETQGVVGAPYSQRRMGGGLVSAPKPPTDGSKVVFYQGGGMYESQSVGMGFTAIHRLAFERLHQDPRYATIQSQDGLLRWYFQKLIINGRLCGEDYSFCHATRGVGTPLHVDTTLRVQHLGEYAYRVEDCRSIPRDEQSLQVSLTTPGEP